jgi:hypothetical protein
MPEPTCKERYDNRPAQRAWERKAPQRAARLTLMLLFAPAGLTITEMADRLGVVNTTVRRLLRSMGEPPDTLCIEPVVDERGRNIEHRYRLKYETRENSPIEVR